MFATSCLRRNSVDNRANRHPRAKGFCALTAALALPVRAGNICARMIDFETVSFYDNVGNRITEVTSSGTTTYAYSSFAATKWFGSRERRLAA